MIKIEEKFKELSSRGEGAYMPHIYYGDPFPRFSRREVEILAENGADFIEFGVPFSDPIADGSTFQEACQRALENDITPEDCIRGIEKLREDGLSIPIIVTSYYNILYAYGMEDFLERLNEAGAQGIIVPDIPIEEVNSLAKAGRKKDIHVILQATPNTSKNRLRKIINTTSGFLYIVNFEGVTGTRRSIPNSTIDMINKVKNLSHIPLMAGFGVSTKNHAKSLVSAGVDGVITGSALRKIYGKDPNNPKETLSDIAEFAQQIKKGCEEGYEKRTL